MGVPTAIMQRGLHDQDGAVEGLFWRVFGSSDGYNKTKKKKKKTIEMLSVKYKKILLTLCGQSIGKSHLGVNYFRKYSFQDSNKNALQAKHKTCFELVYQLLLI